VAILPPILKDQRDGFSEVLQSRRRRPPLAIGSGDLRTVGNIPAAISFYDGGKLIPHVPILAPRSSRKLAWGKEAGRIQVVLPRLVDHPNLPVLRGLAIGQRRIDLVLLKGSPVAVVSQTQNWVAPRGGHIR